MADALLWLYGVAFEELRRAIACDCKERAELLGFMWSHGFRLLEMRQSLAHHISMSEAHSAVADARRQQLAAQQRMRWAAQWDLEVLPMWSQSALQRTAESPDWAHS